MFRPLYYTVSMDDLVLLHAEVNQFSIVCTADEDAIVPGSVLLGHLVLLHVEVAAGVLRSCLQLPFLLGHLLQLVPQPRLFLLPLLPNIMI